MYLFWGGGGLLVGSGGKELQGLEVGASSLGSTSIQGKGMESTCRLRCRDSHDCQHSLAQPQGFLRSSFPTWSLVLGSGGGELKEKARPNKAKHTHTHTHTQRENYMPYKHEPRNSTGESCVSRWVSQGVADTDCEVGCAGFVRPKPLSNHKPIYFALASGNSGMVVNFVLGPPTSRPRIFSKVFARRNASASIVQVKSMRFPVHAILKP